MELNRDQATDILERFDFFQGQRAGRELWNDKPFDVQEQDIANFSRDVGLLKNYIEELAAENKLLNVELGNANSEISRLFEKKKELTKENEARKALNAMLNTEIRRLGAENEAWQQRLISQEEKADKAYHDLACEVEDLRAENERLRDTAYRLECEVHRERANTVRKMQERLNKHFCHDPAFLGVEQRLIMDVIDQIAKEMLEGIE